MGKFTPLFLKKSKMKKYCILLFVVLIILSCGSNGNLNKSKGELVGVKGNKFYPEKPYGMVLIPGGSFIMGKSDDDLASVEDAPTKTVTVKSFYMDETEITNSEYRQFVNWVRDSVLRTALAIRAEEVRTQMTQRLKILMAFVNMLSLTRILQTCQYMKSGSSKMIFLLPMMNIMPSVN